MSVNAMMLFSVQHPHHLPHVTAKLELCCSFGFAADAEGRADKETVTGDAPIGIQR